MKGRALKQKNETIIPNDFFYFYKKIEESSEFNSKLLEISVSEVITTNMGVSKVRLRTLID